MIGFHTFSNQRYLVEFSPAIATTNWIPLPGGEVIGDGRKARVVDTNGTAKNPVGIYGVKLVQP